MKSLLPLFQNKFIFFIKLFLKLSQDFDNIFTTLFTSFSETQNLSSIGHT